MRSAERPSFVLCHRFLADRRESGVAVDCGRGCQAHLWAFAPRERGIAPPFYGGVRGRDFPFTLLFPFVEPRKGRLNAAQSPLAGLHKQEIDRCQAFPGLTAGARAQPAPAGLIGNVLSLMQNIGQARQRGQGQGTEARRHAGTQVLRHSGTQALRHSGTQAQKGCHPCHGRTLPPPQGSIRQ